MLATKGAFDLDPGERAQLERDGLVVRHNVFDPAELRAIAEACEDLVSRLEAAKRKEKHVVGSYMFEVLRDEGTVVKWEPNAPEVMQGVEPFAHISPPLRDWGLDARLLDPCKAIVGQDDIILFTEKLNVKRARFGGDIVLHQDFPYWESMTPIANRVATAMIFLDDADLENGCLEVAPGTHASGKFKQRGVDGFGGLEMDMDAFDLARLQPLEVKAGTVAFFGAFLVHRSLPNLSSRDRRALLYSYQPAGHPHAVELNRLTREKAARASA
ncbi:MAG TPA: phytanoyl-CoA dioxygenase family protein [Caulobacteraceae bacterium]|nr:phytanoyl-CoA dioxygenase family protein [Caulobacteraceae bacterium]